MTDYIRITGLKIYAYHGVFEEEKQNGQEFFLNAKLYYDMKHAGNTDELDQALNYAECCQLMTDAFTEQSFDLIEAAAEYVCQRLLRQYLLLEQVELEVCKPYAPVGLPIQNISVNITRGWHQAYIAAGSNMGERRTLIEDGIREIEQNINIRQVKVSELIETKPYGPVEQPDFLNGCVQLQTLYSPEELLEFLHEVENHANRKREIHWGPRTLDLDILFYDKMIFESSTLVIPHMDLQNRLFVLKPLAQLCPNYRHPIYQKTVAQMLGEIEEQK